MKTDIKFAQISSQSIDLFKRTNEMFSKSKNDAIKAMSKDVPIQFVDKDKKINIVFAGQYSAGKSTIISIMTGKKLRVGQGVTTDQCTTLEWNGVNITDTPGVHTQKHPDHDEITYDAISKADLILFVITAEGFSDHLGNHFRKLLIEKGKGHEMMLVVNKMESSEYGNDAQGQEIFIKNNLLPVISPNYTPEDLYVSFIDAESYNDAMCETDSSEREYLIKQSGFENFYANINRFIKDKNLIGRCTTSLYRNEQLLSNAMSEFKSGDLCVDGAVYLLNKQRGILAESKENVKNQAYNLVRKYTQEITRWGSEIANELSAECNVDEINRKISKRYSEVDNVCTRIQGDLGLLIAEENSRLSNQIEELANSTFAKDFKAVIERKFAEQNIDPAKAQKVQKGATYVKEFGAWLSKMSKGTNAGTGWSSIFKLGTYSGSHTHEAVLVVGHFFGHKFKPWEAVKISGKIGKVGMVLGVVGAAVGVISQIISEKQEEKAEKQLREARADIRNSFDEAAKAIDMEFDKNTGSWIEENYDKRISEIDSNIYELRDIVKTKQDEYENYQKLLEKTRLLIREVHE